MARATVFTSEIGKRIVVLALLTIALVSAGIYGFVLQGSDALARRLLLAWHPG